MNETLSPETIQDEDLDDLLSATLGDLRQIYSEMQEPDWRFAVRKLKTGNPGQHKKAVRAQACVLFAIQELELAELQDIADKLRANAPELRTARRQLRDAKEDMEKVGDVIEATAGVLKLVNAVLGNVMTILI